MIIVYPMLVSSNVQTHILPGIAKVLEKYTLTYQLDDIIQNSARLGKGQRLRRTGAMLKLSKKNLREYKEKEIDKEMISLLMEKGPQPGPEEEPEEKEKEKSTVKVDLPSFSTLSLEPTWIKIDTYFGTSMIGIKVVPFPVKSDKNLIDLITSDFYKNWFLSKLIGLGRAVVRLLYSALHKTPILKHLTPTVSGDPRKDIIFARTAHAKNIFLVLNSMDIKDEFFEKTSKINQLYKLGWQSFVVTDDIHKNAFFCMKEFNGLCSSVQYNFMYTTIGKEHGKVFDNLEDIKKSSSPFFKLTKRANKIAEYYIKNKIDKYFVI